MSIRGLEPNHRANFISPTRAVSQPPPTETTTPPVAVSTTRPPLWRTLLVLGRVSNLPTVWSNCLAAWLLGGGGNDRLPRVCLGATLLYVGGMYLNDACDVWFDVRHRRERPIPAGQISVRTVWALSLAMLFSGFVLLATLGQTTALLALPLVACIVLYDYLHKDLAHAPILMAGCRFFLFLAAASTGSDGVTGLAVWTALALFCYIVGLSYIARKESVPGLIRYSPCLLLAIPMLLAFLVNPGDSRRNAFLLSVIFGLWVFRSIRSTFWTEPRNIGRTVSGLLAGIVLVDLLAVAHVPRETGAAFLALFLAALFGQRYIPAT